MSSPTLNGHHQTRQDGLWLPPSIGTVQQSRPSVPATGPADTTTGNANRSTQAPQVPQVPSQPSAVVPADPVAIRKHHEKAAETEVQRIRAAATDQVSNSLGWLVAILAGLLSLEGFRLFGQMLGWPPIARIPRTDVVIGPAGTLWFTIDVIAFVAMKQWLNPAFKAATRTLGMRVSVAALGISVLINAIGHWFHGGPYAGFAVPAAALPPALLWAVLFLRDRRLRDVHDQIAAVREHHEKAIDRALSRPEPTRSQPRNGSKTSKPGTKKSPSVQTGTTKPAGANARASGASPLSDQDLVQQLLRLDAQHGRRVGQHIGLPELGVGRTRFDRIRAEADRHTSPVQNTNHNPADGGDPR